MDLETSNKIMDILDICFGGSETTFRIGNSLFWAWDNFAFHSTDTMMKNIVKATEASKGVRCVCGERDYILSDFAEFICIHCAKSWWLNDSGEFELTEDNSMLDEDSSNNMYNLENAKKYFAEIRDSDWYKNK